MPMLSWGQLIHWFPECRESKAPKDLRILEALKAPEHLKAPKLLKGLKGMKSSKNFKDLVILGFWKLLRLLRV